jgi:hypothetical protein
MGISIERGHWGFCLILRIEPRPEVPELLELLRDERRLAAWRARMMQLDLDAPDERED